MSSGVLILVGVAVVAILAVVAVFTIAWRRSTEAGWREKVDEEAVRADEAAEPPAAVPVPEEPEIEEEPAEEVAAAAAAPAGVSVATVPRVVEMSPEEAGVSRRSFLNRAMGVLFLGGFLGTQALAYLSFLWPRLSGGFGSDVRAGSIGDLLSQAVNPDGSITPVFVPEARAYVVPAPESLSAQFEGRSVEGGGLMALYQRCVHLGCRVPWCQTSQGFECPCHGSKYNGVGEYFAGPAPRNLDRFVVEVTGTNDLVIKTGSIIETPRALDKSVEYPKGVSCIGGA